MAQTSFWELEHPRVKNEQSLSESHALAALYGNLDAAPAVHQMIATCLPESGYAVMAYPCEYNHHYGPKNQHRRWSSERAHRLDAQKRTFARLAVEHSDEVKKIHRSCFSQPYGRMSEEDREKAARRFRDLMQRRFVPAAPPKPPAEHPLVKSVSADPNREVFLGQEPPIHQPAGGEFGDADKNKLLEKAAIDAVATDYQNRGWDVRSVELDKRGFDLECTNPSFA